MKAAENRHFQPGAVWHTGSVGHQLERVCFMKSQEINEEGALSPTGNRFLPLTQPNCALQWTRPVVLQVIRHRPNFVRALFCCVDLSRPTVKDVSWWGKNVAWLNVSNMKYGGISPAAVLSPVWRHAGAVRLAEATREDEFAQNNRIWDLFVRIKRFVSTFQWNWWKKLWVLNLVDENYCYTSKHVLKLLDTLHSVYCVKVLRVELCSVNKLTCF